MLDRFDCPSVTERAAGDVPLMLHVGKLRIATAQTEDLAYCSVSLGVVGHVDWSTGMIYSFY